MSQELLKAEHINKAFSGVPALRDVSFELVSGEVHALLGENGAGKSTLVKIMSGVYTRDSGELSVNGKKIIPGRGCFIEHAEYINAVPYFRRTRRRRSNAEQIGY